MTRDDPCRHLTKCADAACEHLVSAACLHAQESALQVQSAAQADALMADARTPSGSASAA